MLLMQLIRDREPFRPKSKKGSPADSTAANLQLLLLPPMALCPTTRGRAVLTHLGKGCVTACLPVPILPPVLTPSSLGPAIEVGTDFLRLYSTSSTGCYDGCEGSDRQQERGHEHHDQDTRQPLLSFHRHSPPFQLFTSNFTGHSATSFVHATTSFSHSLPSAANVSSCSSIPQSQRRHPRQPSFPDPGVVHLV
jgi:hypothetical protein